MPASALTADPTPRKELKDIMLMAAGKESASITFSPSPSKGAAPAGDKAASSGPQSVGTLALAEVTDARSGRNNAKKTTKKSLQNMTERTIAAVKDALRQLQSSGAVATKLGLGQDEYKDFQDNVVDRVQIAEAWLGMNLKLEGSNFTTEDMAVLVGLAPAPISGDMADEGIACPLGNPNPNPSL